MGLAITERKPIGGDWSNVSRAEQGRLANAVVAAVNLAVPPWGCGRSMLG